MTVFILLEHSPHRRWRFFHRYRERTQPLCEKYLPKCSWWPIRRSERKTSKKRDASKRGQLFRQSNRSRWQAHLRSWSQAKRTTPSPRHNAQRRHHLRPNPQNNLLYRLPLLLPLPPLSSHPSLFFISSSRLQQQQQLPPLPSHRRNNDPQSPQRHLLYPWPHIILHRSPLPLCHFFPFRIPSHSTGGRVCRPRTSSNRRCNEGGV